MASCHGGGAKSVIFRPTTALPSRPRKDSIAGLSSVNLPSASRSEMPLGASS
jgi:hypothetical protein